MSCQNKYLKYKNKYLDLKKQTGGAYRQSSQILDVYDNDEPAPQPPQTLGVANNNEDALGHTSNVNSVAVNGNRIISGSGDHTIKIWTSNPQGLYTFPQTLGVNHNNNPTLGHTSSIKSVAVYGDRIISGSDDNTIKIWTPNPQGQYTCTQTLGLNRNGDPELGHMDHVYSVAVYGNCIISGSNDHTIKIWKRNLQGVYICTHTLGVANNNDPVSGHISGVKSVAVYGGRIISGSFDHTIKIWTRNNADVYICTHTLGVANNINPELGHTSDVWSIAFIGDRIISGSHDRTIKIWDPNPQGLYTCTQTLDGANNNGHTSAIESIAVNGDLIISGSFDRTIKIWERNQQGLYTCTHTLGVANNNNGLLGHTHSVSSLAVYGDHIISGSYDHTIKIWNMSL
jgi:F-box/WD-40 domain protein 7